MPFYFDPNLEKEDEQNSDLHLAGGNDASQMISGSSSNTKGTGTGSGFQNLDKYLSGNSGKELAQNVVGQVNNQVQNANSTIQDATKQFKNQVNQYTAPIPTDSQVKNAISNPEQADASEFQSWLNAQYKGPNSLADNKDLYNKYWDSVNQAASSAGSLRSEGGRYTLLDKYFGKPTYQQGQKSLDNLLIQNSDMGHEIRRTQNEAPVLKAQGRSESNNMQNLASQKSGAIEQSRNHVRGAIGLDPYGQVVRGKGAGAIGSLEDQIQSYFDTKKPQIESNNLALEEALKSGTLTKDQLAQTGLNPDTVLWNLNLGNYFDPANLTLSSAATPEQKARLSALSKLAGIEDNFLGDDQGNPGGFNLSKFQSAQKAAQDSYNKKVAPTQSTVNSLQSQIKSNQTNIDTINNWLKKNTGLSGALNKTPEMENVMKYYWSHATDHNGVPFSKTVPYSNINWTAQQQNNTSEYSLTPYKAMQWFQNQTNGWNNELKGFQNQMTSTLNAMGGNKKLGVK